MWRSRIGKIPSHSRALSSRWKQQRDSDIYANRAVKEGLRSRAAFKLDEINDRFGKFLRKGACVVDLGAAPGGFSLVAAKRIHLDKAFDKWNIIEDLALRYPPRQISRTLGGSQPQMRFGKLICVDIQEMEPIPGAMYVRGDMNIEQTYQKVVFGLAGKEADVVISDMAPPTTGEKETDHIRIIQLADEALAFAHQVLRNGDLESSFVKVKAVKPAASRKISKEIYYVAQGYVPAHMDHRSSENNDALFEDVLKQKDG